MIDIVPVRIEINTIFKIIALINNRVALFHRKITFKI